MLDGFTDRNDDLRRQLQSLLNRLGPADLDRSLGGGWNVQAALMHLAFWDRFAAVLLAEWQRNGFRPPTHNDDHLNLAALPGWLAAAPDRVANEVMAAASAADQQAAVTEAALKTVLATNGETWVLERSVHRAEHIAEVARALGE